LANDPTPPTVLGIPPPPSTSPAEDTFSDNPADSEMTSWIEKGFGVPLGTKKPTKRKHVDERPVTSISEIPEPSGGKEIKAIAQAPGSEIPNGDDAEMMATKVITKKRKVSQYKNSPARGETFVSFYTQGNKDVVVAKIPKSARHKKRRLVNQFMMAKKDLENEIKATDLQPSKNKLAKKKLKLLARHFLKDDQAATGDCRDTNLQSEKQNAPDNKPKKGKAADTTENASEDYVWSWDYKKNDWVAKKKNRKPRKKYLLNHMQRNWILGMRRLWKTAHKDLMIAKISIKRNELNTVRKIQKPIFNVWSVFACTPNSVVSSRKCRCIKDCMKMGSASLRISSTTMPTRET
jgi:hypothetical protein